MPKNFLAQDFAGLWENVKYTSLSGSKVRSFSVAETLLILCIHGAKHCWNRLDYICDVAELIHSHNEIDWVRLFDKADDLGFKRMTLLGFSLAHSILGADIPDTILKILQADPSVNKLTKNVYENLFPEPGKAYTELTRIPFHLKINYGFLNKFKYLFHFVLTPTFEDWIFLQLPARLYPLYSLFRPYACL